MNKFWIVVILLWCVNLSSNAQEYILYKAQDIAFPNISADSSLKIIEKKIGLHFTYNSDLLKTSSKLNAVFKHTPLSIILDSIFGNATLNYQVIESQIVVYEQTQLRQNNAPKDIPTKTPFAFGGEIRDKETNERLPFASISILNTSTGTISNEEGLFSMQLPYINENDSLIISYLGYHALKIAMHDISKYDIYRIESRSIPLQEVIIRGLHPENLIRLAIDNKKKNYPDKPFVQRAFYRESIKRDNEFKLYAEGILDILKRPYRPTLFNDQVVLIKQRSFKSIESEDTVQFKLHAGIQTSLDLDVVKNSFSFIDLEFIKDYTYHMRDILLNDNKMAYKIEFKPRNLNDPYAYEGCIYLDVETLAFVKLEFSYTKVALHNMRNSFVVRSSPQLIIIPTETKYSVSYKKFGDRYYIHHIQGELFIKVKKRRKFLSSRFSASFEMVATELNQEAPRRFPSEITLNTHQVFSDRYTNYDLSYWSNENTLIPEQDLMKAIENLSQENKQH